MIGRYSITKAAHLLLFIVLIFFLLIEGQQIFIPLTFSIVFAFISLPLSKRMEKLKCPRWLAGMLSVFLISSFVLAFILFMSYQMSHFADDLPMIKGKLNEKILSLQQYVRRQSGYSITEQNKWIDEQMSASGSGLSSYFTSFFSATTLFFTNATIIPIMVFFMLLYRARFSTFLMLLDSEYHLRLLSVTKEIGKVSQLYLKGLFIDIVILSVLKSIGFIVFNVEHAILFAIFASVLNIIPYFGVVIGGLIPMMMVMVTQDDSWAVLGVLGVTIVVQFFNNNFIYPKIVGSSVSINPLVAMIALIVGNLVWGTTGMILALPLAGMLKVVLDNLEGMRPYSYLMSEDKINLYDKVAMQAEESSDKTMKTDEGNELQDE